MELLCLALADKAFLMAFAISSLGVGIREYRSRLDGLCVSSFRFSIIGGAIPIVVAFVALGRG